MYSAHGPNCPRRQAWYGLAALAAVLTLAACGSNTGSNNQRASAGVATSGVATSGATVARPVVGRATATPARSALPGTPAGAQLQTASASVTATATAGTASPAGAAALQAQIVEPKQGNAPSDPMTWTFTPNTTRVTAGGDITWTNTGISSHTVTADDGTSFDSGAIQRGDSWTFAFTKPGTFTYHCTFHNWMKGTVVVGG